MGEVEVEAELRGREQELAAIYENVPGILFYISADPDGDFRFVAMSRAGLIATGLTREQIIGARVRDVIPSPSREMVLAHYREAIRTGHTVRWEETSDYPSGTRHGEVAVTPLFDSAGVATHLIGIVHDVTERRQAERRLEVANRKLVEADKRKNEFLAMLGHELRNPLAAIQVATKALLPQHLQQATGILLRQTAKLVRVVEDLLEVSRVTSGKFTLKKVRTDILKVVNEAVEDARPLLDAESLHLCVDVPPQPIVLDADPTRLAQALVNLLTNAAKYTPAGGRVRVSATRESGQVVLTVTDTGVGIAADMIKPIFDLFVQVDATIELAQGGLGIGLPLVRIIAELHGGTAEAFSEGPGRGSEFVIRIPEAKVLATTSPQPKPTASQSTPRRVLVVEDNRDFAEGLASLITGAGHVLRLAHDGPSALETAKKFNPEVVILDIGLPLVDGYEVARRLRELPGLAEVTLIALSGYGDPEHRARSSVAGFDLHLVKSSDLECIEDLLATPSFGNRHWDE